jgi:phosphohistidine phosphatase
MTDPKTSRRLIVMRHAKAGDLPGGPDAERALTPRGMGDATRAGQWLAEQGYVPDAVICSTARRARQTWRQVSAEFTDYGVRAHEAASLYEATAGDLLEFVRDTADQTGTLMYVGHNPAAGSLADALTSGGLSRFPTSAIAVIEFSGRWSRLNPGDGTLIASWTPRG